MKRYVLRSKRTDLAAEFAAEISKDKDMLSEEDYEGVKVTKITLGRQEGKLIGKPSGRYVTIHCQNKDKITCGCALAHYLGELLKPVMPWEKVLVASLGNEWVTPDSLGSRTIHRVPATAHLSGMNEFRELGLRPVYVFETGVMGQTGVESASCLSYLTDNLLPAALIVVDSLACSDFSRLCSTVQLTDSGIAPGSGVGGGRKALNSENMGTRVIAIGVPTVIDLESVANADADAPMMVTPKNIDSLIDRYSGIISQGINSALNPCLSREEMEMLMPNGTV